MVLRIHTNPYSTFNDCLKMFFFFFPSLFNGIKVQQGQLQLVMMSLKFLFPRQLLHSFYFHTFALWRIFSDSFLNWTWGVPVEGCIILGWQTETCQNLHIHFLAIEGQREKTLWYFCLFNNLKISKKPLYNSTCYTKESKTVVIIHKICVL